MHENKLLTAVMSWISGITIGFVPVDKLMTLEAPGLEWLDFGIKVGQFVSVWAFAIYGIKKARDWKKEKEKSDS
jgi:hypothetical protein